jgi:hypothetical protein
VSWGKNRRIFQPDERTRGLHFASGLRFSNYFTSPWGHGEDQINALANDELKEILYEIAPENKI